MHAETVAATPAARTFEVSADGAARGEATVAAWERHNAEALVELSCRVPRSVPFRARERSVRLDTVRLALVQGSAHAVARDRRMVAERPSEAIGVYAALRGDVHVDIGGARAVVRPGQVLVCDLDRPLARTFGRGLEELAVRIPRAALTTLTGAVGFDEPVVADTAADPYAHSLVRLVGRAVRSPSAALPEEQTLVDLVAVLTGREAVSLPVAHRAAAKAFIDDHLGDATLAAADVARAAGVSERHLSRLFAEVSTSVPRHVLARRLDLAHALLSDGAAARTVDVAARCGFTSNAHFSQAFTRRFGVSAGEVLRQARAT